jgi:hypothetical protein
VAVLTAARALLHFRLLTRDGRSIPLRDLYFNDDPWLVHYFVIDVHRWVPGQHGLISTSSVTGADWSRRLFDTPLSVADIRRSPCVDTVRLVSRRATKMLRGSNRAVGDPAVSAPSMTDATPTLLVPRAAAEPAGYGDEDDAHLRSLLGFIGYTVTALDREIGRVDNLLVDNAPWEIRYVVVDTTFWRPGRYVLVPTPKITLISPLDRAIHVHLTGADIRSAPTYNPSRRLTVRDEARLLWYYSRRPQKKVDQAHAMATRHIGSVLLP